MKMSERPLEDLGVDIKSVVQSAKGGVSIRKLQGELKLMTGEAIQFQKYGFNSLEALLRSIPHVVRLVRGPDGDWTVNAVADENTQHLSSLIAKQKCNKSRAIAKPRRLSNNYSWRPPHSSYGAFNSYNSRPPSRPTSRNFHGRPLLRTPPPPRYNQPRQMPKPYSNRYNNTNQKSQDVNFGGIHNKSTTLPVQNNCPPLAVNNRGAIVRSVLEPFLPTPYTYEQPPRFLKQQQQQQVLPRVPPIVSPTQEQIPATRKPPSPVPISVPTAPQVSSVSTARQVSSVSTARQVAPVSTSQSTYTWTPIQKVPKSGAFVNANPVWPTAPPQPTSRFSPPPISPTFPVGLNIQSGLPWQIPKSNKQLVDNYAYLNGTICVYRPMEVHNKKKHLPSKWLSTLVLGDHKFNSYPEEMDSAEEANEEAAKRAVDILKIITSTNFPFAPTGTSEEIDVLVGHLREMILDKPLGAFHYHLQEEYKTKYGMRLPHNWVSLVESYDNFRIDRADETHLILFYEKSSRSTPDIANSNETTYSSANSDSSPSEATFQECLPEALSLPDSICWEVYITCANNTGDISFRLIDYADQYEDLSQKMEEYYLKKGRQPVTEPIEGGVYCGYSENTCHRISILDISEDRLCFCHFLDNGETDYLDQEHIFELQSEFLQLPFQALRADLAWLSCFSEDMVTTELLVRMILGKSLVAKPMPRNKQDNPESSDDSDEDEGITLVLYDTSTDDDININQALLEVVINGISRPTLPQPGRVVEGVLCAIQIDGNITLQLVGRELNLLNRLIENVVEIFEAQRNTVKKLSLHKTYCVKRRDNKWHRAICTSEEISVDNKVSMRLIDFEQTLNISLEDVCQLDGDTALLANIPVLAVTCRLNGIGDDTDWAVASAKLLKLIPQGTKLLIKVATEACLPSLAAVDIFKRLEPNKELVSINQTLSLELSNFDASGDVKVVTHGAKPVLTRPNSFQAPSPPVGGPVISPLVLPPGFQSPAATPTSIPSPTASYFFTDIKANSSQDTAIRMQHNVALGSSVKVNQQNSRPSSVGNPSPPVAPPPGFSPNSDAGTTLPNSASIQINTNTVFDFGAGHKTTKASVPDPLTERGITKQQEAPDVGDFFDVIIVNAATPTKLICQSFKSRRILDQMFEEMQQFYNSEENVIEVHQCLLEVGNFFALKHNDGLWYRVFVKNILGEDPFMMMVYLVDYGSYEMCKMTEMQPLYNRFRTLPFQAISASLAGLQLNGAMAGIQFQEMVNEKQFVSVIKEKCLDTTIDLDGVHLSLTLIDTSTPEDIYIDEELIKKNIVRRS